MQVQKKYRTIDIAEVKVCLCKPAGEVVEWKVVPVTSYVTHVISEQAQWNCVSATRGGRVIIRLVAGLASRVCVGGGYIEFR